MAALTPFQQAIKRLSDGDVDARARRSWQYGRAAAAMPVSRAFYRSHRKKRAPFQRRHRMLESSLETLGKDAATLAQLSEPMALGKHAGHRGGLISTRHRIMRSRPEPGYLAEQLF